MDAIEILLNAKNSVTDRSAMMSLYNATDFLRLGHYDWCETYEPGICNAMFSEVAQCREHPVPYPSCAACGMTVGAVMFREYEAGTEWLDGTCCA